MTPIGPTHAWTVDRLLRLLRPLEDRAHLRVQNPLRLSDLSEPEPDIAVVHLDDYRDRHPSAVDALLVIEVADTSLDRDVEVKTPLYLYAGVRQVWVVDLTNRHLLSHTRGGVVQFSPQHSITPSAFPDFSLDLGELFG